MLQYNRIENRGGLLSADLAQLSGGVRFLLVAVVLAVAAACFVGAYWAAGTWDNPIF